MSVTVEEINGFHSFALQRLTAATKPSSMDELLMEWQDLIERDEVNAAIRRGLADVAAGRHQPAAEATAEVEARFGFPKR